jgi:DNA polymerase III delta prime subunit
MSSEPANIDWPFDLPWLAPDWRLLRQRFNGQQAPPHALMLTGAPGSGRTATANHIAAWLLCQQAQEDAACGTCTSCRMHQAGSHPDLLQVKLEEDANTIKVDQIRALIHALQALLQLYDQAAESAQTVASGLRQDLQINAWLLRWQGMCASHAIMQRISP